MNNYDLKGITWGHIRGYGPLDASIKSFKEQSDVRVTWNKRSLKDFGDAPIEKLALEYDLIIMDHPHIGVAASSQCLVPLDEVLDNSTLSDLAQNSAGPSYDSYHYNHHQWALPIDAACQVASFRMDLLNHFLPERWDEVFELAYHLKSQKQYIGMALCPTDCLCSFLTLCAQQGDAPMENKNFLTTEETGYYTLKLLRSLYRICHPESIYWNPISLYDHMTAKDEVVYCPLAFGYINYSHPGYSKNQLQYGEIPGKTGALLGGAGIAVSKYCRNIPMAAKYAAWLCGDKFQSGIYIEEGGQPANKIAWENKNTDEITNYFFSKTFSTIEKAYVRPRVPDWPPFQEKLGEIIHFFLLNNIEVKKTWREITDCYEYCFLR